MGRVVGDAQEAPLLTNSKQCDMKTMRRKQSRRIVFVLCFCIVVTVLGLLVLALASSDSRRHSS